MLDSHKPIQKPESLQHAEESLFRTPITHFTPVKVDNEKLEKAMADIQEAINRIKAIEITVPDTTESREAVEKASKTMNELIAIYRKRQKR